MKWKITKKTLKLKTQPFSVEELEIHEEEKKLSHNYFRLSCSDFVNVLPVTSDNQAILIRQPRVGPMKSVLETPGGMVDQNEKDPTMAAARELEEETGYTTSRLLPIGSVNPNPALFTNRCHYFLGLSCSRSVNRKHFPDPDERIQVEMVPLNKLDFLVRTGQIDHSLSALCIFLAGKYIDLSDKESGA